MNAQIGSAKKRGADIIVYDKNGYELSHLKNGGGVNTEIIAVTNSFYVIKEKECTPAYNSWKFDCIWYWSTFDYKSKLIKQLEIKSGDIFVGASKNYIYINNNNIIYTYNENFELIGSKKAK